MSRGGKQQQENRVFNDFMKVGPVSWMLERLNTENILKGRIESLRTNISGIKESMKTAIDRSLRAEQTVKSQAQLIECLSKELQQLKKTIEEHAEAIDAIDN